MPRQGDGVVPNVIFRSAATKRENSYSYAECCAPFLVSERRQVSRMRAACAAFYLALSGKINGRVVIFAKIL